MKSNSDMRSIREVAYDFLNIPIQKDPLIDISPHPFIQSAFLVNDDMSIVNIFESEEAMKDARNRARSIIDSFITPEQIITYINKPYRMAYLKYSRYFMFSEDFSRCLKFAYTSSENPNIDVNVTLEDIVDMFECADPNYLMDEEEYLKYSTLFKRKTAEVIYRGVGSKSCECGCSWTTSYDTAKWFATRFGKGRVLIGEITTSSIYAYFDCRNEDEVIVDPNSVTVLDVDYFD